MTRGRQVGRGGSTEKTDEKDACHCLIPTPPPSLFTVRDALIGVQPCAVTGHSPPQMKTPQWADVIAPPPPPAGEAEPRAWSHCSQLAAKRHNQLPTTRNPTVTQE